LKFQPLLALGVVAVGAVIALALHRPAGDDNPKAVVGVDPGEGAGAVERFVLATMWSPTAGFERSERFVTCLEEALGGPVQLVQRETYAEGNAQLLSGNADLGLICTGATANDQLREDFVPVWRLVDDQGLDTYRSVVVVREDDPAQSLEDLAGASVAWVDPSSLTGYLALRHELVVRGHHPDTYFGTSRFTHSHDRSTESVAGGVLRAAPLDEVVFREMPERDRLRVVWTSQRFPAPAFVARRGRVDLIRALGELATRRDCLEPLGAIGLVRTDWDDYEEVRSVVELGR
jgi:ABC-type phosphate/phosphonate transport system substrate-binding protein